MVTTPTALPKDLLKPRTLAQLMGIYESNYQRLLRLVGDPRRLPLHQTLYLPGLPPLVVSVQSCSRYTLDLVLSHRFGDESVPDLRVRLYHDARLAEAVADNAWAYPKRPLARLPGRWRANMLLYKWLEYCNAACSPPTEPCTIPV
ncbi:MAG: DUF1249 domain-containing protein [Gammaproteobacteria bacterium]